MRNFFLGMLLFWGASLLAQRVPLQKLQPSVNMGFSIFNESLPEGAVYNPYIVVARGDLLALSKRSNGFYVYAEPQLVAVLLEELRRKDYEFGMNLGFEYRTKLWAGAHFSVSIGSGPHFITVKTQHQAQGFIFSDNFEVAFSQTFAKVGVQCTARLRYRHISNAGLQEPNLGIDNGLIFIGLAKGF